jgi:hypothetical protein
VELGPGRANVDGNRRIAAVLERAGDAAKRGVRAGRRGPCGRCAGQTAGEEGVRLRQVAEALVSEAESAQDLGARRLHASGAPVERQRLAEAARGQRATSRDRRGRRRGRGRRAYERGARAERNERNDEDDDDGGDSCGGARSARYWHSGPEQIMWRGIAPSGAFSS